MPRIAGLVASALSLVGCAPEERDDTEPDAVAVPAPEEGRVLRHTSLSECAVVREETEEMPFVETLCPGPSGWALRVTDSDARQNLIVVAPDGRDTSLDLSRVGGGGFSSLGETAEWRGPAVGTFAPDSLIVRYQVAEQPFPAPEVSYLLAVDLAPPPCVVARVAPRPEQNAIARARADEPGACLTDR